MPQINGEQVYEARVEEVHSGDDLMIMVNLGIDSLYKKVRARLRGVDTPDAYKESKNSEAGKVRETVRSMVANKRCCVLVHAQSRSGWMITLYIAENANPANYVNLNEHLIELGYIFEANKIA